MPKALLHTSRIIPPPPLGWAAWEDIMQIALAQAHKSKELGEVPVGAVVVTQDGRIVGKGHNLVINSHDPTAHAEIVAIRNSAKTLANYRLLNCYLVVTLEPCLMCVGAMVHARFAGVVYGAKDLKAGAVDSCTEGFAEPFLNHKPWHMGGIMEEECCALLQNFFLTKR